MSWRYKGLRGLRSREKGNIGIMDKKIETTSQGLGILVKGKQHGNEMETAIILYMGIIGSNISQASNGHGFLLGNMLRTKKAARRTPMPILNGPLVAPILTVAVAHMAHTED